MNIFFDILSLDNNDIDSFINKRINELNLKGNYEEISLSDEGKIYPKWINTNTPYLPSGFRSKGFKIDIDFIKEFVMDIKNKFGRISIDKLKNRLNEIIIIEWFNMYIISYFGSEYKEKERKEIYGYGSLNSIGKNIKISDLKDLSVARCIEKSASLNTILNFLDIDSSLVLSNANGVGHSYCLVNTNNQQLIVDPNFYGTDANGKGIPYIFEIDIRDNNIYFDPSLYGDYESEKIYYDFPNDKYINGRKR